MTTPLTILTGASRGMGLAMARQLLQPGHTLLTLSRTPNHSLSADAAAAGATLVQLDRYLAGGDEGGRGQDDHQ